MKKLLLLALFTPFFTFSQVEIEPFAPSVTATYIGDFETFTPGQDIPTSSAFTEEGDTAPANNLWTADDGTVIADFSPGATGQWAAGTCEEGDELILVTPEMDFGAATGSPTLDFRYIIDNGTIVGCGACFADLNLDIMYKESAGGAWTTVTTFSTIDNTWYDETVDLSGAADYSTFYIGFRIYEVTPGSLVMWGYCAIDEIVVTGTSCVESTSTQDISACKTYTVPSGDETYTASGVVMDTIPNSAGCDSVMTINLTVTTPDVGVSVAGGTITADAAGVSYQWIDCNTLSPVVGATSQNFTPAVDGSYAVIIDVGGGCTDTSICSTITGVGIDEFSDLTAKVYPNPTDGNVTVHLSAINVASQIELLSIDGKVLSVLNTANKAKFNLDLSDLNTGVYFVRILDENSKGYLTKRIIKK